MGHFWVRVGWGHLVFIIDYESWNLQNLSLSNLTEMKVIYRKVGMLQSDENLIKLGFTNQQGIKLQYSQTMKGELR